MRTDDFRPSDNVEDDRQASASRGGLPGGAGGLGIGTIIIIGLISWYFGIDPSVLLNGAQILTGGGTPSQTSPSPPVTAGTPTDPTGKFVALVLGDTEDRWKEIFAANGRTYHPPRLRLFSQSEPTPCAFAQSATGPFYCPRDQRIYLDISFFDDLEHKFAACSDSKACRFSEAYVIAHEVGHHVQDELGLLPRVMQMEQASASRA
jgi:predicted metalloprotease